MSIPPLGSPNGGLHESSAPRIPYYCLWSEPAGISRIEVCTLNSFAKKNLGGQAAPIWMRQFPGEVEAIFFAVLPVGWVGEWHESPKPQWVVPLSGRWFIEAQDGSRIEMGPGDIHWGEDIGTSYIDGGRGHRSGQIGNEPCTQLMIQFANLHTGGTPCPFS